MLTVLMSATGIDSIGEKLFSECGLIGAMLAAALGYMTVRLARTTQAWDADRADAIKRIDFANATIVRLIEESKNADKASAIALARLEVMVASAQARNGNKQ